MRLFPDGWGWRQPDRVVLAAASAATTTEILDWAKGTAVEAPDGDPILLAALREGGYHEISGEPFSLSMRRAVTMGPAMRLTRPGSCRNSPADTWCGRPCPATICWRRTGRPGGRPICRSPLAWRPDSTRTRPAR